MKFLYTGLCKFNEFETMQNNTHDQSILSLVIEK